MRTDAEKAEFIQSVTAFLIPASLFLSTVIMAAGTFLIYNGYALGWGFIAFSLTVMTVAIVAFARFQNKLRAGGRIASTPEQQPTSPADQAGSAAPTAPSRELDRVS